MDGLPKAFTLLAITLTTIRASPAAEPWYGDYVGELKDLQRIGIKGHVYVVNDTCIQIIGFTYFDNETNCRKDLNFWIDEASMPSHKGVKLTTFEYGHKSIRRYENARVVIKLPLDTSINEFTSFGLWCHGTGTNYGYIQLPQDLKPPAAKYLNDRIIGRKNYAKYKLSTGPILILDRRTIKILGFTIQTFPSTREIIFAVGKGSHISKHAIHRVPIRGIPESEYIPTQIGQVAVDYILDLPESHDVYNIDWLSVYHERFNADFGHVNITSISDRIPPFVPPVTHLHLQDQPLDDDDWPRTYIVGNKSKTNFTFQLGIPGGRRAYASWMRTKPAQYVWYINGQMSPELWLEKDVTYNFFVEGGDDISQMHLYHPLYITNDSYGGYSLFSKNETKKVNVYAGLDPNDSPLNYSLSKSFGRACVWLPDSGSIRPDDFASFAAFQPHLKLKCLDGAPGHFQWTPSSKRYLPDTLFYQSFTEGAMGGRIVLSNEVGDMKEDSLKSFNREMTTKDKIPVKLKKWPHQQTNSGASNIVAVQSLSHKVTHILFYFLLSFCYIALKSV